MLSLLMLAASCVTIPDVGWLAVPLEDNRARSARAVGNRLWVVGDEITSYDPCTNQWRAFSNANRPAKLGPSPNHLLPLGDGVLLFTLSTAMNDMQLAFVDARGWRAVGPVGNEIVGQVLTHAGGGRVLHWGGVERDKRADGGIYAVLAKGGVIVDVGENGPRVKTISRVNAPSPRSSTQFTWMDKQLFVWGGVTKPSGPTVGCDPYGTCELAADGALYDPAVDRWTTIENKGAPSKRAGGTATWTGTRVVVFGGWSDGVLHRDRTQLFDGGIYDPATNTWEPIPSGESFFKNHIATVVHVGGADNSKLVVSTITNDVPTIYDMKARSWAAAPTRPKADTHPFQRVVDAPWPAFIGTTAWGEPPGMYRFELTRLRWQRAELPRSREWLSDAQGVLNVSVIVLGDRMLLWRAARDRHEKSDMIVFVPTWTDVVDVPAALQAR